MDIDIGYERRLAWECTGDYWWVNWLNLILKRVRQIHTHTHKVISSEIKKSNKLFSVLNEIHRIIRVRLTAWYKIRPHTKVIGNETAEQPRRSHKISKEMDNLPIRLGMDTFHVMHYGQIYFARFYMGLFIDQVTWSMTGQCFFVLEYDVEDIIYIYMQDDQSAPLFREVSLKTIEWAEEKLIQMVPFYGMHNR